MTTENARGLWVGVAAICAVAGIGFFTGIRGSAQESAEAAQRPPAPSTTLSARSYADMREQRFGPNADMYQGAFAKLAPPVSANDKVPPQTLADKMAALAARAKRRAYDGAPPVVPHAIAQFDAPACLTCLRERRQDRRQDRAADQPPAVHQLRAVPRRRQQSAAWWHTREGRGQHVPRPAVSLGRHARPAYGATDHPALHVDA